MRNWKNLPLSISGRAVPSTGSAVLLRLSNSVTIAASVLFAVSCRSGKTLTQEARLTAGDSVTVSAVQGVSIKSGGGTPGTGTARIRIRLEPVGTGNVPSGSPAPDGPQAKGGAPKRPLRNQTALVIEAEAGGTGGTAQEVDAQSVGESRVTKQGVTETLTRQESSSGTAGNGGWRKARDALLWILAGTLAVAMISRHPRH